VFQPREHGTAGEVFGGIVLEAVTRERQALQPREMLGPGDRARQRFARVRGVDCERREPAEVMTLEGCRQTAAEVEQVNVPQRSGLEQLVGVPDEVAGIDLDLLDEPATEFQPVRQSEERGLPLLLIPLAQLAFGVE
jgi:hypothetical protein